LSTTAPTFHIRAACGQTVEQVIASLPVTLVCRRDLGHDVIVHLDSGRTLSLLPPEWGTPFVDVKEPEGPIEWLPNNPHIGMSNHCDGDTGYIEVSLSRWANVQIPSKFSPNLN
jgi:hypothetical protein